MTFLRLLVCLLLLPLSSCSNAKRLFAKRNYIWPKYISQADFKEESIIPGAHDVLTVTLLKYNPWHSHHNRRYTVLRLKTRSLYSLPVGTALPLSDSVIHVSGYNYGGDHFTAYFEQMTGTIERRASQNAEMKVRFDLRYKSYNADRRFRRTVVLTQDSTFFKASKLTPSREPVNWACLFPWR